MKNTKNTNSTSNNEIPINSNSSSNKIDVRITKTVKKLQSNRKMNNNENSSSSNSNNSNLSNNFTPSGNEKIKVDSKLNMKLLPQLNNEGKTFTPNSNNSNHTRDVNEFKLSKSKNTTVKSSSNNLRISIESHPNLNNNPSNFSNSQSIIEEGGGVVVGGEYLGQNNYFKNINGKMKLRKINPKDSSSNVILEEESIMKDKEKENIFLKNIISNEIQVANSNSIRSKKQPSYPPVVGGESSKQGSSVMKMLNFNEKNEYQKKLTSQVAIDKYKIQCLQLLSENSEIKSLIEKLKITEPVKFIEDYFFNDLSFQFKLEVFLIQKNGNSKSKKNEFFKEEILKVLHYKNMDYLLEEKMNRVISSLDNQFKVLKSFSIV